MLLTRELPFAYPPSLYAARVEGDVGLRLFIDSLGLVVPESTTVVEPSGHAEFDSAAVAGAPYLEFHAGAKGWVARGKGRRASGEVQGPARRLAATGYITGEALTTVLRALPARA